jgi:hypothetical protein
VRARLQQLDRQPKFASFYAQCRTLPQAIILEILDFIEESTVTLRVAFAANQQNEGSFLFAAAWYYR